MSPRLANVSGEQAVKALKRLGFEVLRQRGSHVTLQKQTQKGTVGCVVPMHRTLAIGTLHNILQQANVTSEEFLSHL